jgi:hypothetical protein
MKTKPQIRTYDDYLEDLDDAEGFAYDRSQSLHRLVKDARREERRRNRRRGLVLDRRDRDNWDWDDEDSSRGYY